ncbi:MAG TPA: cellulase family glycosylhydrolase [Tepidisphaeraceae bacterium]|jgi:hypothetical protein|nr:cellulase family glycosylhydrolase [Tepidisphaeraceae bacterium]
MRNCTTEETAPITSPTIATVARRSRRSAAMLLLAMIVATPAIAQDAQKASAERIVDCEATVQSHKRGLCANQLSADDFREIAPGVSWWYNWHYSPSDLPPQGVNVEFVPMVWGGDAERLGGLKSYLAAGHKPRAVLALNEPNLKGQAFITPKESADAYKRIKAVADQHKLRTIGPHMALGSSTGDSIKAFDPIEKKDVTYTFMVPFLKAFLHHMGKVDVEATAFHSYGHLGEMRWAIGMMHDEFKRPMWITEYAQWSTPNSAAALTYLVQSTDLLERSQHVEAYAWFKERVGDNQSISLFRKGSGELTALGEAYVAMPVHDADLYYRLPGRLQAERYVTMDKMEIAPTTDADGFLEMATTATGATINYNVHVTTAGDYRVRLRVGDTTGKISIGKNGESLADVTADGSGWRDVETTVQLPQGSQTLQLQLEKQGQTLNWIEFTQR